MDKYYGLIAMLVVVLGIAGVFVWVYLPRDESTGPTALAVTGPTPCRPNKKPGGQKLAPPFR